MGQIKTTKLNTCPFCSKKNIHDTLPKLKWNTETERWDIGYVIWCSSCGTSITVNVPQSQDANDTERVKKTAVYLWNLGTTKDDRWRKTSVDDPDDYDGEYIIGLVRLSENSPSKLRPMVLRKTPFDFDSEGKTTFEYTIPGISYAKEDIVKWKPFVCEESDIEGLQTIKVNTFYGIFTPFSDMSKNKKEEDQNVSVQKSYVIC